MKRRDFLKTSGELAAAVTLGGAVAPKAARAAAPPGPSASLMVAIQLGAVSLVDEGIEACLDILQERGAVNTIMPAVFSFSRGTAGRHKPYPGHGKDVDDTSIKGGNYATVHPDFYRDTGIDPRVTQATDHPGFDVLGDLIPHTRKRGMKVIGVVQNSFSKDLPGIEKFQECDLNGKRADSACMNNPYHRNFLMGLVDDYIKSYDVDGLMYVNETQGAFNDMLGARFRGRERGKPGARTCFCGYCKAKAKEQGIRVARVVPAFEELQKFVDAGRAHRRPVDGYYVTLWRLMLRHPELLQWEHLYHESTREVYRLMYGRVKAARKEARFGLHLWTNASMSAVYRAEQDVAQLSACADFLKLALYNNCGGPRMASFAQSIGDTVYGDFTPAETLQFHHRILNYPNEAPYDKVSEAGLSPDYVYREAKRALDGRGERGARILAGIDVDIPITKDDIVAGFDAKNARQTTRARVCDTTKEALRAGVDGIVISRKYSEMKLDHLSGIGDAVREPGRATR